jgi:hypothetical protein
MIPIQRYIGEGQRAGAFGHIAGLAADPNYTFKGMGFAPKSQNIPSYEDWAAQMGLDPQGFGSDGRSNAMAYLQQFHQVPDFARQRGIAGALLGDNSFTRTLDKYDAAQQAAQRGYGPYVAMAGVGAMGAAGALAGGAGGAAPASTGGAFAGGGGGASVSSSMLPALNTGTGALTPGVTATGGGLGGLSSLPAVGTSTGTLTGGAGSALAGMGGITAPTGGTLMAGATSGGGGLVDQGIFSRIQQMLTGKLSDPFTLAQTGIGLYDSINQRQRANDMQRMLEAGFNRSDPFAPGRGVALEQYMDYANNPQSYMSSPLAQMQIDELNRAMRSKQAGLGQTFSIDPVTGNIRGSGTGAMDFATHLQTNLAKQYETVLGNRAQQAGMQLFPSAGMLESSRGLLNEQNAADQSRARSLGLLVGAGRELFPEISQGWQSGIEGIRRGIFGA